MKLLGFEKRNDHLILNIAGTPSRFHYLWLRDNCPACRSPNGQKLHESNRLDPCAQPKSIQYSDDELVILWRDGTESSYSTDFLQSSNYDVPTHRPSRAILWSGTTRDDVGHHDYEKVRDDASARHAWLFDVAVYGFSLLKNVPAVEDKIFDVVALFGFVKETNYGKHFDVRAEENATNLAFTPEPLSVHTDNPYREPCPTLQLLHCLLQAHEGGLTALSDGFYAAEKLRAEAPDAFELLAGNEVSFRYESETAILESRQKIICLDSQGQIEKIHINNRSLAPLKLTFDRTLSFYDALSKFRSILESDDSKLTFAMQRGDLVLLDNERVLHGRAGLSIGERHLQGCYADRDGLLSTLRVLEAAQIQ